MNIVISNNSEEPIYMQVYGQIAAQILSRELPANFCLPSIRNVAAELNISVITVKNAWEMLEKNNFIYTKSGKGCFVADFNDTAIQNKKLGLIEEKLIQDLKFYQNLSVGKDELIRLIKKHYNQ